MSDARMNLNKRVAYVSLICAFGIVGLVNVVPQVGDPERSQLIVWLKISLLGAALATVVAESLHAVVRRQRRRP